MRILASLLLIISAHPAIAQSSTPPPAEQQRAGLWIADTPFSPADIAGAEQSFDGENAQPNVVITFTESGRLKFIQAQQGRVEQHFTISVDGETVATPFLVEMITGPRITISGSFTVNEAKALARRIAPLRRR